MITTLNSYEDIPPLIRQQIDEALAEDILERYNHSEYHNQSIIDTILKENNYKLK